MKLPTIYKKTKTGKIQEWTIEVKGSQYRTISGHTDSDNKITNNWSDCEIKNAGKANATTPEEQCLKEAEAKRKKKLESGYFESIKDINKIQYFEPMLAQKYEDHEINYPVYSQPKLDGCLSYDTLVCTDMGLIKIGEIVEKQMNCKVKSYNLKSRKEEFKDIVNYAKDGKDINEPSIEWYEVGLSNGNKIEITGNHLIYLPRLKCWRRVDELNENDVVLLENNLKSI